MIYFTSDLHFGHDKAFMYKTRGFSNIAEHDQTVINNWNKIVTDEDDVYVLGDLMLGDNQAGLQSISKLTGKIHVILGNHDTDSRIELYKHCSNIVEVCFAKRIRYKKYHFFLCHYPVILNPTPGRHSVYNFISLFGHTHQTTNFFNDNPFMYHVGLNSHNNMPVDIDTIIEDCQEKAKSNSVIQVDSTIDLLQ